MTLTADELLARRVFSRGVNKPFGDLSAGEVAERADELAAGAGFGHASRVAAVASAWRELARTMAEHGAGRVDELDRKAISDLAERLWIAPPGGSLLP
jgi:hypothetical protein